MTEEGRLDSVLAAAFPDLSRARVQRLIASEAVLVDGAPARTGMPYASNHPGEIGPAGDSRLPSQAARRTAGTASEHGPRLRLAPRPTPCWRPTPTSSEQPR